MSHICTCAECDVDAFASICRFEAELAQQQALNQAYRALLRQAALMGPCSQEHHEHLTKAARHILDPVDHNSSDHWTPEELAEVGRAFVPSPALKRLLDSSPPCKGIVHRYDAAILDHLSVEPRPSPEHGVGEARRIVDK